MSPSIIKGGSHTDHRGTLRFMNDFDMSPVRRFYTISHPDTQTTRGWRGHRIEQRWFYVTEGVFEIEFVSIDDWKSPSKDLPISSFIMASKNNEILHVPVGYATRIRALEDNSRVILFADYSIENTKLDDHLWPLDYFKNKK